MFACTGILYNHDSPLRPKRFVTRNIIYAVASLALKRDIRQSLGNLEIERDWGWAPEYVQAISMMLERPSPVDYIVATGQSYTLTQFVKPHPILLERIGATTSRSMNICCDQRISCVIKSIPQRLRRVWAGRRRMA